MSALHGRHPAIPAEVPVDEIIAIVTVHGTGAVQANRNSPYQKTRMLVQRPGRVTRSSTTACNIFLTKNDNKIAYNMGRWGSKRVCDVYFTEKQEGGGQLILAPVQASNAWRIRCTSYLRADVNGVPIQSALEYRQGGLKRLPCAVYLRHQAINCISIQGVRIDVWLLKTPIEAFPTANIATKSINNDFQDCSEQWARHDLFLLGERVSKNSHRIVHRFTGAVSTAKVFRNAPNTWELRAKEFAKFGKDMVDKSIVRYHAMVEIDNMPAVITDSHEGLQTYAAVQADIKTLHMGSRFLIAAKLQRRLFSALGFLHSHGIAHGAVAEDSVLLNLTGRQAQTVLLVSYSATMSVPAGTDLPRSHTLEDGRAAMEIVADCCDIWHARKAAARNAEDERFKAGKTATAREELDLVKRVIADLHQKQGRSRSRKRKRLLRLVQLKQQVYERCRADQEHSATGRELGVCLPESIEEAVQDWARSHAAFRIGETAWMHLSLGHPYFDNLANELYRQRWDTTPREVCAQFKSLAGDIEEPWQPLVVKKPMAFRRIGKDLVEPCILGWIASCCESYPEWRHALEREYHRHVRPRAGLIRARSLRSLHEALSSYGDLPASISGTFEALRTPRDQYQSTIYTKASHRIMQHLPSRMFNLTQLHRLASPENFVACVESRGHRCDNYVEVRGEPSLQGCYAPLALLAPFASRLGLSLPDAPKAPPSLPAYDPADFSQVPTGRIVLVRTGLVGFASVVRSGDQCDWHAPRKPQNSETINSFLTTYFGDMKVMPKLPDGVQEYSRPAHWSAFKTAEELETAADLGRRRLKKPVGLRLRTQSFHDLLANVSVPLESTSLNVEEPPLPSLSCMLKKRERRRGEARPVPKHSQDESSFPLSTAKRARTADVAVGATTYHSNPPADLFPSNSRHFHKDRKTIPSRQSCSSAKSNLDTDFTVQDGEFDIQADWKRAEELLAQLPHHHHHHHPSSDSGFENPIGFRIHGPHPLGPVVSPVESSCSSSSSSSSSDVDSSASKPARQSGQHPTLRNKPALFQQGVLTIPWIKTQQNAAPAQRQDASAPTPHVADWLASLP